MEMFKRDDNPNHSDEDAVTSDEDEKLFRQLIILFNVMSDNSMQTVEDVLTTEFLQNLMII